MCGSTQQRVGVLLGEVRDQLGDAGQVEATFGQHGQEDGILPGRSGRRDPQIRLGLGEMEDLRAIGEHRRGGFAGVEPAFVDLADVGHEVGFGVTRLT
jgi:hypothetical protein